MERLRRLGRQAPSAATERLLLALTLSLGLHAFLLYQYASHLKPSARPGLSIINARINASAPEGAHGGKPLATPQSASGRQVPLSPATLSLVEPSPDGAVADAPVPEGPVSGRLQEREPPSHVPETLEPAAVGTGAPDSDLPDPVHYPAKELDVYPRLLTPPAIDYPETAGEHAGKVMLLLLVDESGRVTGVSVVDAQPEGVYEDAVARAYSGAMFSPARKDGRAVRSRILVAVDIASALAAQQER